MTVRVEVVIREVVYEPGQRKRRLREGAAAALVRCSEPGCGRFYAVGARALRAIRAGERSARCPLCAYRVRLIVTDELRAFWIERFTLAEIRAIALASWGDPGEDGDWGGGWRDGFEFAPSRLIRELAA